MCQVAITLAHELANGADSFKKHDQLQLEKYHGINGRAIFLRIARLNEGAHKREIQLLIQVPLKMILRDRLLQ